MDNYYKDALDLLGKPFAMGSSEQSLVKEAFEDCIEELRKAVERCEKLDDDLIETEAENVNLKTEKIVITVHEPSGHSAGIRGGETRVTIEDFHSNHPEADLKQFMAEYFDVLPMQVEVQYITD